MRGPPISVADVLRAFAAIGPKTDEEKRAIAAMLGFVWRPPSAGGEDAAADAAPRPSSGARPPPRATPPPPPAPAPKPRARSASAPGVAVRISAPRQVPPPLLEWLASVPTLEQGPLRRAHDPAPLFRPQWTRAILRASLSASRPVGPPDLARTVELIACGQVLRDLPRQPILTLARGVQALIDVGERLQPFAHDGVGLQRDLRRVVGDSAIDILECAGSPRRVRRVGGDFDWHDYDLHFRPGLEACVLIVSDFGIGQGRGLSGGASPFGWAVLARRLARAGHRVVGFVPSPPERWPPYLARTIALVPWDRATTAGRISQARVPLASGWASAPASALASASASAWVSA